MNPINNPNGKDPMHGVKLVDILEYLEANLGWEEMANFVNIRCFKNRPNMKSSLAFLRRTPWARKEVEDLYLKCIKARPFEK